MSIYSTAPSVPPSPNQRILRQKHNLQNAVEALREIVIWLESTGEFLPEDVTEELYRIGGELKAQQKPLEKAANRARYHFAQRG